MLVYRSVICGLVVSDMFYSIFYSFGLAYGGNVAISLFNMFVNGLAQFHVPSLFQQILFSSSLMPNQLTWFMLTGVLNSQSQNDICKGNGRFH